VFFVLKMLKLRGPVPTPRSNQQQQLRHSLDTPAAVVSRDILVVKLFFVLFLYAVHWMLIIVFTQFWFLRRLDFSFDIVLMELQLNFSLTKRLSKCHI